MTAFVGGGGGALFELRKPIVFPRLPTFPLSSPLAAIALRICADANALPLPVAPPISDIAIPFGSENVLLIIKPKRIGTCVLWYMRVKAAKSGMLRSYAPYGNSILSVLLRYWCCNLERDRASLVAPRARRAAL